MYAVVGYDAINVEVTNGAEVKSQDVYAIEITENGLRKLQRMVEYKVFVNVR